MAFRATACALLNARTRCELTAFAARAWLDLRLQLIALLVLTGVIFTAILGRTLGFINVCFTSTTLTCMAVFIVLRRDFRALKFVYFATYESGLILFGSLHLLMFIFWMVLLIKNVDSVTETMET